MKISYTKFLVGIVLVFFISIEFGARYYQNNKEEKYTQWLKTNLQHSAHFPSKEFHHALDFHLMNLYTMNADLVKLDDYRFDRYGARIDQFGTGVDDVSNFKTIWMFGGSTTQGQGIKENETISYHLNGLLEKNNTKWKVINLGTGGHSSYQELYFLLNLLQMGKKPDAIIIYDGINETPYYHESSYQLKTEKAKLLTNVQLGNTSLDHWKFMVKNQLYFLKIYPEILYLTKCKIKNIISEKKIECSNPYGMGWGNEKQWKEVINNYLNNLNLINALATGINSKIWFFFQPTMEYEQYYKLRQFSSYENNKLVAMLEPDEHVRRELINSSEFLDKKQKLDPKYYDLYDVFKGYHNVNLYNDPRHPNSLGNRIIAENIYEKIKKQL